MAPSTLDTVEDQLKIIIHHLYSLMVQAHEYAGPQTGEAMKVELTSLLTTLQDLTKSTSPASLPLSLPPELIQYVENGRNPDIYTREFVELVQARNQQLKGRADAFAEFRDALGEAILSNETLSADRGVESGVNSVLGIGGGTRESRVIKMEDAK